MFKEAQDKLSAIKSIEDSVVWIKNARSIVAEEVDCATSDLEAMVSS